MISLLLDVCDAYWCWAVEPDARFVELSDEDDEDKDDEAVNGFWFVCKLWFVIDEERDWPICWFTAGGDEATFIKLVAVGWPIRLVFKTWLHVGHRSSWTNGCWVRSEHWVWAWVVEPYWLTPFYFNILYSIQFGPFFWRLLRVLLTDW